MKRDYGNAQSHVKISLPARSKINYADTPVRLGVRGFNGDLERVELDMTSKNRVRRRCFGQIFA